MGEKSVADPTYHTGFELCPVCMTMIIRENFIGFVRKIIQFIVASFLFTASTSKQYCIT
jgi:hypothetical protein